MKKNIFLLLIITLVITLSGCTGDKSAISRNKDTVITYLSEKYDEQFSVLSVVSEFDGYSGKSERYLCKSGKYSDIFSTIIYYDSTYGEDVINIDNNQFGIEDDFAEIVFENEILNNLNLNSDITVKCNIDFNLKHPNKSEFESGLESCLNNEELLPYVKFYILANKITDVSKEYNIIKNWISQNKPYTAYIYTAVGSELDKNEIDSLYFENKYNFGNLLAESKEFQNVKFTLYEEGEFSYKILS